jgi:hypothetical protein
VQIYGKIHLPFCGTKTNLMGIEDAGGYIDDIKNGKNMNDKDETSFCKRCISSVLAEGSDLEKDRKRISRYQSKQTNKIKKELEIANIRKLRIKIKEEFLYNCPLCNEMQQVSEAGFIVETFCKKCNTKWIYSISCEIDGTFKLYIDKDAIGKKYKKAIGNILCEEPFINYF